MEKMADGKGVTVLFLGSGFSKAVGGVPIQKDFLDMLLLGERKKWVDECGLMIGGNKLSDWMLRIKDIELCMSHLHNLAYSGLALRNGVAGRVAGAIISLRVAMREFIGTETARGKKKEAKENFRSWLKTTREENNQLVILTTNYDELIEDLLAESFGNTSYEYYCIPLGRSPRKTEGTVPLYKLHGSANWMEKRKENGEGQSGKNLKIHDEMNDIGKPEYFRENYAHFYNFNGDRFAPIVIPFFYQKADWLENGRWKRIFEPHWKSAEIRLRKKVCQFYFMGYSLPPADHYMMSWLLNILDSQNPKPEITIVSKGDPGNLWRVLGSFNSTVYTCGLEHFLEDHANS